MPLIPLKLSPLGLNRVSLVPRMDMSRLIINLRNRIFHSVKKFIEKPGDKVAAELVKKKEYLLECWKFHYSC